MKHLNYFAPGTDTRMQEAAETSKVRQARNACRCSSSTAGKRDSMKNDSSAPAASGWLREDEQRKNEPLANLREN